ncbi:MAG: hypothetical protein EOO09_10845 [Chitinophagaceae bacterium]|nr:MAG: hypothetical protein EOO09_10845 [Chitinophagaceae bacterium]
MKKLYPLFLLTLLLSGCSKDFLKRYDKRIIGTWELYDVDRRGLGGDLDRLGFTGGSFVFAEDGRLTWTNPETGAVYTGVWDIDRIDNTEGSAIRIMNIHVTNFSTQETRSELFEEMQFTGTDRFKAFIYSGLHRYVFRFRR